MLLYGAAWALVSMALGLAFFVHREDDFGVQL
jgi:hypothetical protein